MYMGNKSIAFVHNTMAIGGIERSLINLLNRVDYTKVSVDFYMLTTAGTLINEINPNVNIYFRINALEKALAALITSTSGIILTMLTIAQKAQRRLTRFVSSWPRFGKWVLGGPIAKHYDAVFALNQGSVQVFALENLNSDKKYAFYHNGNVELFNRFLHLFQKFDGIIIVSHTVSGLISSNHPTIAHKLQVMHNIVPKQDIVSRSMEDASQIDRRVGRCIIVSCGRLYRDKGFDLAVDAARIMSEQKLLNFSWYIIGDGKERHRIERRIKSAALQDRVFLFGGMKNPYPLIRACDIYVQPSRIESFGISMVEAQVLGKVVVATDTLGAKEVIEDGVTGILCEISASDIAAKVTAAMSSSNRFQSIKASVAGIEIEERNSLALQRFYNLL